MPACRAQGCVADGNRFAYRVGIPSAGRWSEAFNSDDYDAWGNPDVVSNGGSVEAVDVPMHGYACFAELTPPANSFLAFSRG